MKFLKKKMGCIMHAKNKKYVEKNDSSYSLVSSSTN